MGTRMIAQMVDNSDPADFAPPKIRFQSWNEKGNSFNNAGWATCGINEYMTGLSRNYQGAGHDEIYRVEGAGCSLCDVRVAYPKVTDCYDQDWNMDPPYNFNIYGWSQCKDGYFMSGLYRTKPGTDQNYLHNIETAKCCKPRNAVAKWGTCYQKNVWDSFNSM